MQLQLAGIATNYSTNDNDSNIVLLLASSVLPALVLAIVCLLQQPAVTRASRSWFRKTEKPVFGGRVKIGILKLNWPKNGH